MQRRRRTAAQIRARIVEVAGQLAAERPFHEVSTREIARRAGVQQSVIYRYFPSKGALAIEMMETASSVLDDRLAESTDAIVALQLTHEHLVEHRELLQIAATEPPPASPDSPTGPPGDATVWTVVDRIAKHRGVDADDTDARIDWLLAATLIAGSALVGDYLRTMSAADGLDADAVTARFDALLGCIVDGDHRRS
jgi:AcrR family transcriptional regulator